MFLAWNVIIMGIVAYVATQLVIGLVHLSENPSNSTLSHSYPH